MSSKLHQIAIDNGLDMNSMQERGVDETSPNWKQGTKMILVITGAK
ncbi:hypothetical protein SLEP1_g57849 [Rubroshorea leprosula]|uniref:Uncharacterized protein n=1 Tax=Rubroshorea leprosula TaxID=152421 RepID=A0AAV5MP33_9ROSI|nr:hypothetical protein SLEP1_g57849 [Rubroshorea leprosula]